MGQGMQIPRAAVPEIINRLKMGRGGLNLNLGAGQAANAQTGATTVQSQVQAVPNRFTGAMGGRKRLLGE